MQTSLSSGDATSSKPIFFWGSLISTLLGWIAPLLLASYALLSSPIEPTEEGDLGMAAHGMLIVYLILMALMWWGLWVLLGIIFAVAGVVRKERGRARIWALSAASLTLVATLLALILIVFAT